MPSLREVTQEQFSDGTAIDAGTRVERALADLVAKFNGVPARNVKRRWFPAVVTGGHMPSNTAQLRAPWLSAANVAGLTSVAAPVGGMQNEWRNKGLRNVLIDPDVLNGDQLVWTTALHFERPVIVTGISLFLLADGVYYTNTFAFTGAAPAPKTGLPSDDVFVELAVDSPWRSEDAMAGAQEFLRTQFRLDGYAFNPSNAALAGYVDPVPLFAANAAYGAARKNPEGAAFWKPDLNIALPERSDVRLAFCVPLYPNAGWSGWGILPWRTQYCSWDRSK